MSAAPIVLVDLSESELEDFIRADIDDFAEQLGAETSMSLSEARDRAERELGPRLQREHAAADRDGQRRFTAVAGDGASVGWLWITPPQPRMPPDGVFLYQILVKPVRRREGYGRAMLAALEGLLVTDGIAEIRLNVFHTNERARALYASAGYEVIGALPGRTQLRKRLDGSEQPSR